jgi:HTH-type transcriptional regulator/antitoxin HigA
MDIAPIKNDATHRAALAEIERLWGAKSGTRDGDRLDVLMTLVDSYERARWPDAEMDAVDALKARMENSGRSRKEFAAIIGSSGRASEILNRKRHLTLGMIWRLSREWSIPAEILIQPYKLSRFAARASRPRVRTRALARAGARR